MLNCSIRNVLSVILLGIVPAYTWRLLITSWFKLRENWKEVKIFQDRHNCVVMFSGDRGLIGYPHWKKSKTNIIANCCEPILYFIRTAKKSIDIAIMTISSDVITEELLNAHKRGIQIRLLVDFYYGSLGGKKLENSGISVLYYVSPYENARDTIFHYKYAVKDYSEGKGYLCLGSINWVTSSFQNNFENLIFCTDPTTIEDFHCNFEEAWNMVRKVREDNYNVRAILHQGR